MIEKPPFKYVEAPEENTTLYIYVNGIFKNQQGYTILRIEKKVIPLHRYIWQMYNGKIPKGKEINHKDRNINNNKIENLELVTKKQNLKYRKYT